MGTFGVKPWESDDAVDLYYTLKRNLMKQVAKGMRGRHGNHYQTARAAIDMMVRLDDLMALSVEELDECIAFMVVVLSNQAWLDAWRDRAKATRRMRSELDRLVGLRNGRACDNVSTKALLAKGK